MAAHVGLAFEQLMQAAGRFGQEGFGARHLLKALRRILGLEHRLRSTSFLPLCSRSYAVRLANATP
jgi:hypothetical protein